MLYRGWFVSGSCSCFFKKEKIVVNVRTQRKGLKSPFWAFITDYWYIAIGIVIAVPLLFRFVLQQIRKLDDDKAKSDTQEVQNDVAQEVQVAEAIVDDPVKTSNVAYSITPKKHLHLVAQELVEHLKVKYAWYDPRSYFADNPNIIKSFGKINRKDTVIVERLYNKVYAPGRNLRADCLKRMENSFYQRIRWT